MSDRWVDIVKLTDCLVTRFNMVSETLRQLHALLYEYVFE